MTGGARIGAVAGGAGIGAVAGPAQTSVGSFLEAVRSRSSSRSAAVPPVRSKGFAVTLAIGIITSMFSAIWLTRLMISVWVKRSRPTELVL